MKRLDKWLKEPTATHREISIQYLGRGYWDVTLYEDTEMYTCIPQRASMERTINRTLDWYREKNR